MRKLFWRLSVAKRMDGDHVEVTDPYGVCWIKRERLEEAVSGCDFLLTIRLSHIENVIDILRDDELVDPCGFALQVLAAHGYDVNGAQHS